MGIFCAVTEAPGKVPSTKGVLNKEERDNSKFPMKIGYPCINLSLPCRGNRTFRLASFQAERFHTVVQENLACLRKTISYNIAHGLLFFRISSDLVPFASHPVLDLDWAETYRSSFQEIGTTIRRNRLRISMHPDQFVVLNSPRNDVVQRSIAELEYHARVLDLMQLDSSAKVQVHAGGVYGDPDTALERFAHTLTTSCSKAVRRRLVIENDERNYSLKGCMVLHRLTNLPVLLDTFHHSLRNDGESLRYAIRTAASTWKDHDGVPMVDYSSQEPGKRPGTHAHSIDISHFRTCMEEAGDSDMDVMLEIKDKERSALYALEALRGDPRLSRI